MTKFNAKKTMVDGINFDSEVESKYYVHLMKLKRAGEIKDFTMQPAFVLQEAFSKHGEDFPAIKYKGDFQVWYNDGTTKVIDVKGMKTPEFKLKEKLYAKQFDVQLICVSWSGVDGGWIEYSALQKARAKRKKEKEALEKKIVKEMKHNLIEWEDDSRVIATAMDKYSITKPRATKLLKTAKGTK